MMGDLFVRILNVSMVSCYTIVVVMVLRALLLRWERKFVYLLWFVVFVNLCIPFRPEGPFSLVPGWIADFDIATRSGTQSEGKTDYLPNEEIAVTETRSVTPHSYDPVGGTNGVPGTDSNSGTAYIPGEPEDKTDYLPNEQITVTESMSHGYESGLAGGIPGTDTNSGVTYHEYYPGGSQEESAWKPVLALVWGAGVILLAAGNMRAVWKLRGKLRSAEPVSTDCGTGENIDQGIRVVDGIESPFLWGLPAPVIYLPGSVDAEERTYIIAHESYHKKRKDHIFKPLFFAVAVIHWFNPLVWAAYLLFVRDMEISCDEAVVASADEDIRKKYAASLLKYAARQNGYTLTPITFGEPSPKCRIKKVLQYRERNVMASFFVLCGVAAVMAGLFFRPRQERLMTLPSDKGNVQIMNVSDTLAADITDVSGNEALNKNEKAEGSDAAASQMGRNWKAGMISGVSGENEYTEILLESDALSGGASHFCTFAFEENTEMKKQTGEGQQDKNDDGTIVYVMAGSETGGVLSGSLWLVDARNRVVQLVGQDIAMTGTQAETIIFDDAVYVILNYMTGDRADGRILPVAGNALSAGIMADYSGEKRIGDVEGTIVCNDKTYWLIDAETVRGADKETD